MWRSVGLGVVYGLIPGLAAFSFMYFLHKAMNEAPHLEWRCTASHTVRAIALQPAVDAQGYTTLMPMNMDHAVCDQGYPVCVEKGNEVGANRCQLKSK